MNPCRRYVNGVLSMLTLCQGRYCLMLKLCQGSRSMLMLCQGYVKGGGPCRHWLPLFDVKHIFCIFLIKNESMSTLCQWSIVHVDFMSREILSILKLCQGSVKGGGPCRRWFPLFDVKQISYILSIKSESMSTLCQWNIVHVDVMSREIFSMSTLCQGIRYMSTLCQG